MTTGLTVVDDFGNEPPDRLGPRGTGLVEEVLNEGDLDTLVMRLVKDDPFASISEIKHQVRTSASFPEVGWWRIFSVLKRHGLLGRRSRFRFARGKGRAGARRF